MPFLDIGQRTACSLSTLVVHVGQLKDTDTKHSQVNYFKIRLLSLFKKKKFAGGAFILSMSPMSIIC